MKCCQCKMPRALKLAGRSTLCDLQTRAGSAGCQVQAGSNGFKPVHTHHSALNRELDFRFSPVHSILLNWTFSPVLFSSGSNRSSELNFPITTLLSPQWDSIILHRG